MNMLVGQEDCDLNLVVITITESQSIQQIKDGWQDLARRLHIKPITINEIRDRRLRDNYNISDILCLVLQTWTGENGENATLNELINVFEAIRFKDAAFQLRKRFNLLARDGVTYVNIGCNADRPQTDNLLIGTNAKNPDQDESAKETDTLRRNSCSHTTSGSWFKPKLTRKRVLFSLTFFLFLCGIGWVVLGYIDLSKEVSVTEARSTTSSDPSTTSEVTSTTPEKPTVTSERTKTRLPTCPYKDWNKLTCPAGNTWACWADESRRNEENCSQWGKIYGWKTLPRFWPKQDCYCCSKINCTFP